VALRVLCVGRRTAATRLARAASAGHVAGANVFITTTLSPETSPDPHALEHCDAVCVLDPVPAATLLACAAAGRGVLAAGPPASLTDLAVVAEAFEQAASAWIVNSPAVHGAAASAVRDAARGGRAGAPVYLRYACEHGVGVAGLDWAIAGALQLTSETLGDLTDVFAAGTTNHLSLSLSFADGSTALVGLGGESGDREPREPGDGAASLLLVGDQGVVEGLPPVGGGALLDGEAARPLRDGAAEALAGWLAAGLSHIAGSPPVAATRTSAGRARSLLAGMDAVRASLASGQPARVAHVARVVGSPV
jgi:hypothetical protein